MVKRFEFTREKCSCGAVLEMPLPVLDWEPIRDWRLNHRHEPQQPPASPSPGPTPVVPLKDCPECENWWLATTRQLVHVEWIVNKHQGHLSQPPASD